MKIRVLTSRKVKRNPGETATEPAIAPVCPWVQIWVFSTMYHQKESGLLFSNLGAGKVLMSREDVF